MNILLLGSGGREHALAWKMKQSPLCGELFIAPGNAGTDEFGKNLDIGVSDFEAQKKCCLENNIEMVVVGPEEPLVKGIYDFYKKDPALAHIKVIGPSAHAAQLEGSKAFAKAFMHKNHIPTAAYFQFDASTFETGKKYIETHTLPIVLKADGLAGGKGVVIAETHAEALKVLEDMLINQQFGEASSSVVIEQFLKGIEISVFVLTDGKDYKIIGSAKDYKRIGEGDTGLNTGGMGCVSPVPFADAVFMEKVETKIIQPTIEGLHADGFDYKGFVFFGLISVNNEPYVIEYNCRMGDPETEVVIPRLKNDLVELFLSIYNNELKNATIDLEERAAATVVAVSGGYPGDYKKGMEISGLPSEKNDTIVFHSGTKKENGAVVTNGGRVLAVTTLAGDIQSAVDASMKQLESIKYEGINFRRDIGYEFRK
jgi:phosphoribosylamine--glycine ligase